MPVKGHGIKQIIWIWIRQAPHINETTSRNPIRDIRVIQVMVNSRDAPYIKKKSWLRWVCTSAPNATNAKNPTSGLRMQSSTTRINQSINQRSISFYNYI
jgi:hypothetical protein